MPGQSTYIVTAPGSVHVTCSAIAGNPASMEYTFFQKDKSDYNVTSQDGNHAVEIPSEVRHGEYECFATNTEKLKGPPGTFFIDVKGN